jgi:hypothetical protein
VPLPGASPPTPDDQDHLAYEQEQYEEQRNLDDADAVQHRASLERENGQRKVRFAPYGGRYADRHYRLSS